MELKQELQSLKEKNDRMPEHYDYMRTASLMLKSIGSTDYELRDELIYSTFSHWILQGAFTADELRILLYKAWDEGHMFYKIGEAGTDSVFTRSFSVLLLPLILTADQAFPFLAPAEINVIKDKLIRFLQDERDFRGYVKGKGWAHAIAHAADALEELSKRGLPEDDMIAVLDSVRNAVCIKDAVYTNLEDERLTSAVLAIFEQGGLEGDTIKNWLGGFTRWDKTELWQEEYKIISNAKNFLATLYFRLCGQASRPDLAEAVKQARLELMKPYM